MKKVALILSGCGNRDGAEITEAVALFIQLQSLGADVVGFAPNLEVPEINHLTGQKTGLNRNVLVEAARILRGKVKDIKHLSANEFDALCFSGGSGVAQVLSTWAQKGATCEVLPDVKNAILDFHKQSKPIGAVCIAPVLLACVLGKQQITVTVGQDKEVIAEIKKTGALHENCPVDDYITDRDHKIITSPAYMYDAKPHEVFKGISGLAKELVEMA